MNPNRIRLVHDTFGLAADQDYLFARAAAQMVLGHQFAWSSAQAIEKYTKCALLLNGINAKAISHNFVDGIRELNRAFPSLFPEILEPDKRLKVRAGYSYVEGFLDCLMRFEENADPNRRYRQGRLMILAYDLQKLDQITFILRNAGQDMTTSVAPSVASVAQRPWRILDDHRNWTESRRNFLVNGNLPHFGETSSGLHNKFFFSYEYRSTFYLTRNRKLRF